ncbi:protein LURP-one-related 15 [Cajanus cajan]|uniref:protein LURP-one-related 15 n=1 Tax=Cajanus cajan TaxID=3821 RepID=UPI00098DC166|nr:protein LURP-one-related 15 [Cajanus cajan]
MAQQLSVINPSYCVPDSLDLQINTKKGAAYNKNGDLVFKVIKETWLTLHHRRVLYDDKGNPIVTLYKRNKTLHGRCQVFRGKSNDLSQLLFSAKKSSMIQSDNIIRLDVYLANNQDESMCDFRVIISGNKSTCTFYFRESPTIVAKVVNNGDFRVCISPNVDHAFIVALTIIVSKMGNFKKLMSKLTNTANVAMGGIATAGAIASVYEALNTEGENMEEENLEEGNLEGENLEEEELDPDL